MRWIWIRHGETDANRAKRYIGHVDEPLNDRGRTQAESVARHLAGEPIAAIYSSDLLRCADTAKPLRRLCPQVPFRVSRQLRECSFGVWEGRTYAELMSQHAPLVTRWLDDPLRHAPPGGETLAELDRRLAAWVRETALRHAGETICVVTHGGPLRWVWAKLIHNDWRAFWTADIRHGQAWVTEWDDGNWRWKGKWGGDER